MLPAMVHLRDRRIVHIGVPVLALTLYLSAAEGFVPIPGAVELPPLARLVPLVYGLGLAITLPERLKWMHPQASNRSGRLSAVRLGGLAIFAVPVTADTCGPDALWAAPCGAIHCPQRRPRYGSRSGELRLVHGPHHQCSSPCSLTTSGLCRDSPPWQFPSL
jgi:hypothetical protein